MSHPFPPTPPPGYATSHLVQVWEALAHWTAAITEGAPQLVADLREARIVWIVGNGGSQACAEHWATDWHKATQHRTQAAYVAPGANAGLLTMLANDFGYDQVFAHALAASTPDDVVIALSTSGRSANLLQQRFDWAVCPEGSLLARGADRAITGRPYPAAVLEDVFSILGHAIAEELRA